jgi:uncharacterized cupin superfamily protein
MTLDMSRTHVAQYDRLPAVLTGKPRLSTRISYRDRSITAGVFEATRGRVEVTFPFTEYATVLEGEVTITDESGRRHAYRKGDSYLVLGGQPVVLDVRCPRVRQSFFSLIES